MVESEVGWFDKEENNSEKLLTHLSDDATYVRAAFSDQLPVIAQDLSAAFTAVVIGLSLEWRLALMALTTIPFLTLSATAQVLTSSYLLSTNIHSSSSYFVSILINSSNFSENNVLWVGKGDREASQESIHGFRRFSGKHLYIHGVFSRKRGIKALQFIPNRSLQKNFPTWNVCRIHVRVFKVHPFHLQLCSTLVHFRFCKKRLYRSSNSSQRIHRSLVRNFRTGGTVWSGV